jgi:hypothetical protein
MHSKELLEDDYFNHCEQVVPVQVHEAELAHLQTRCQLSSASELDEQAHQIENICTAYNKCFNKEQKEQQLEARKLPGCKLQ